MPRYAPSKTEWHAINARVSKGAGEDGQLADNLLFSELYHHERGLYPRKGKKALWVQEGEEWVRYKRNLSRREWIEQFFPIRDKQGKILRLILNPGQRKFYVTVLRMERAGMPVRIQILKARQLGFSTLIQAMLTEMELRGEEVRGLIVADTEKTSAMLLAIADLGLTRMFKSESKGVAEVWRFKLKSNAKDVIQIDRPSRSITEITSAKSVGAGIGGTRTLIHFSEGSRYEKPEQVHSSALPSLPDLPGTYGFDESTAYGAIGKFHDDFQLSWPERDTPLRDRIGWVAVFFAWWEHPEYAWTRSYGLGREMPADMVREIENTLDDEEKWLMKQKWLKRWSPTDEWEEVEYTRATETKFDRDGNVTEVKRLRSPHETGVGHKDRERLVWVKWRRKNVGWQNVSVDQLAWRRRKLADKQAGADGATFNQDYPSRPEVAFRSTGAAVFDSTKLDMLETKAKTIPPVFRGVLRPDPAKKDGPMVDRLQFEAHPRGGLLIWAQPEPGRDYILASDTAGGGARSDAAVVCVLDGETGDIVAGWRERSPPHEWGPKCAWLAWHYNEGMLGFETQPSTHGLAAANEAKSCGYTRQYYRITRDTYHKTQTPMIGFHNHAATKPDIINEVKKAIDAGFGNPWTDLIRELKRQYWDETGKMASTGADDMVDAYGIALVIRLDCYARQLIRQPEKKLMNESEKFWAKKSADTAMAERARTRMTRGRRRPRWIQ